ncbi:hypothetical protein H0H92_006193, partial [Tricholoma furcatifolium]
IHLERRGSAGCWRAGYVKVVLETMTKHPNLLEGECLASSLRVSSLQSRPPIFALECIKSSHQKSSLSTPLPPRVSTATTGVSPESPYYIADYERAAYYNGISPDTPALLYRTDLQTNTFPAPQGRFVYIPTKTLHGVFGTQLNPVWPVVGPQICSLLQHQLRKSPGAQHAKPLTRRRTSARSRGSIACCASIGEILGGGASGMSIGRPKLGLTSRVGGTLRFVASFVGNVLDIGTKYSPYDLTQKFYPQHNTTLSPPAFQFSTELQLRITSPLSAPLLASPDTVDAHGQPCLIVFENGRTTDLTVGRYAGEAYLCSSDGVQSTALAIYNYDLQSGAFAAKGTRVRSWSMDDGGGWSGCCILVLLCREAMRGMWRLLRLRGMWWRRLGRVSVGRVRPRGVPDGARLSVYFK